MTISDTYYSRLNREYPMLSDATSLKGVVTDYRIHWQHAYVVVNSTEKIHIRPAKSNTDDGLYFDDLISGGDSLFIESWSDEIRLKKQSRMYKFLCKDRGGSLRARVLATSGDSRSTD
jgi:hypothetical protein